MDGFVRPAMPGRSPATKKDLADALAVIAQASPGHEAVGASEVEDRLADLQARVEALEALLMRPNKPGRPA